MREDTKRTDLVEKAKRHLWLSFGKGNAYYEDPETSVIIESADGNYVIDVEGNRYFDATGAQATASAGFNNHQIIEAMSEQLGQISSNPSTFPPHTKAIQLAERIATLAPEGFDKVFFGASGTDANETAVKIVRQYFRLRGQAARRQIVVRWNGYHGSSLSMTAASGNTIRRKMSTPLPEGYIHIEPPYCYRCPYGLAHPDCHIRCADEIRRVIEHHDSSNIAAFLGEPTIGSGGVIPGPKGYWKRIRDICDEFDMLLVFDEAITGFGRVGDWFESLQLLEEEGVRPDMISFGKGAAGGYYPLSGVIVSDEIAAAFEESEDAYLYHGYTFGGTPLGATAALATINFLEEQEIFQQVKEKSRYMLEAFQDIQRESKIVGDLRHKGLLFALELVSDKQTKQKFDEVGEVKHFLFAECLRQGLLMVVVNSTMLIMPPLTITMEEIEDVVARVRRVVLAAEDRFLSEER